MKRWQTWAGNCPLSVKIGEEVLTTATCGEDNTISFNFAPDLSAIANGATGDGSTEPADPCANVDCGDHGECQGGKCVCTDNYTGDNCETAPDPCDGVACDANQYCANGKCVCQTPCGAKNPICCAEGTYCGSKNGEEEYECITEEGCEDCSNKTSWTTGTVSVQYCAVSEADCLHVESTLCTSITLTCGTDDISQSENPTNRKYCYNAGGISWWDAKSICKALGMRLPSINELIKRWDGNFGEKERTQFAQNMWSISKETLYHVWSSNLSTACLAWRVNLSFGLTTNHNRDGNYSAVLCVQ